MNLCCLCRDAVLTKSCITRGAVLRLENSFLKASDKFYHYLISLTLFSLAVFSPSSCLLAYPVFVLMLGAVGTLHDWLQTQDILFRQKASEPTVHECGNWIRFWIQTKF